ncbi:hypothetical protein OH738_10710 [Streptomyces hirsutus]|uniref:Secreted protein n=1 Tax=Streptomyces hirsutus TaxID=35620 RepID=A0ABZ1GVX8_9ACTN|nr:hypothetical protein [Streptomyces hirsutus]WSD09340.1 hypothetical protein OIE73_28765 [Streptomyces hirsutus]WTD17210.1 hypothetical protein OH738_10710 [Streptomyces hirsutus]
MQPEVLSGLIGFGGAAVGAGGAFLGTWLQQRHQAQLEQQRWEKARADLLEERGRAAADKALAELYVLRRHISSWKVGMSAEEKSQWYRTGHGHTDNTELNAALIPEANELRERLRNALEVVRTSMHVDAWESEHEPYLSGFDTEHAIALLSAYMRGDPLPSPSPREARESVEREMREEAWAEEERQRSNPS